MLKMTQYTGTKTIKACPVTLGEAEKILGRKIDTSSVEDRNSTQGYLVEYEDGYRSWSPKEVFERAYKVSETYLDRMRIEHDEEKTRYHNIADFIFSAKFRQLPKEEKQRIRLQAEIMRSKLLVLGNRIQFAEEETAPYMNVRRITLSGV